MTKLFNRWWKWTAPDFPIPKAKATRTVYDARFQTDRVVPCWSDLTAETARCVNPLDGPGLASNYSIHHPMSLSMNGLDSSTFVSGSPSEILEAGGVSSNHDGRTWDQEALVSTINGATQSLCLSVMDFIPSNLYDKPNEPVWWPALFDSLMTAATTRGIRVRLLISKWANSSPRIFPYLRALQEAGNACQIPDQDLAPKCTGSLEVRLFEVPGWNETKLPPKGGEQAGYPAFSRVNHAKYIVSDQRLNIGTSNMAWSYFYNTAGASFNSDHPGLREGLQAIFDRDWDSIYSTVLR